MKDSCSNYEHLMSSANNMHIIDTHEHLNPHKNYIGEEPDVLHDYFSHYITSDLQSAGLSEIDITKIRNYRTDLLERFKLLEPWLEQVRNTSYFRSLEISARLIHDINEISLDTISELNNRYIKAVSKKDYGRYIMKDICNIEVSINDNREDDMCSSTTELFVPAWQPVAYLNYTFDESLTSPDPCTEAINLCLEELSFDEYLEHCKLHFHKQVNDGAKTLKFPVAYWRSLYFEDVGYAEAKSLYTSVVTTKAPFPKKLQDYMMHFILGVANEKNFAVQIHTGLQEGMNNDLENSNPMLLKRLFSKYPNVFFDLFHTGYPYERELIVLAKTYANVYVDFCWSHIISPFAARNALSEMLDVLPYSKIFGFGGDYLFFDGVVGHLTMAKKNICTVLAQKVTDGDFDVELADTILQAILYDNAKRVFKL